MAFGQWGKPSEAGALHHELLDRSAQVYVPAAYLALTAEAGGNRDEALGFAQHSLEEREPTLFLHVRYFPEFRTLRADPRFAAILREMDSQPQQMA